MDKTILTDCDGVLLDWESSFQVWVSRQGYCYQDRYANHPDLAQRLGVDYAEADKLIQRFNSSADFEKLEAWRDSVTVVRRLKRQGWKFVVITTAGLHPWTHALRKNNLDRVFGPGIIDELHVLELHGNKGTKLADYQNSGLYWIEDKPSNAELGFDYGLKPLLMNTSSNSHYRYGKVPRVKNWTDIESIITGS